MSNSHAPRMLKLLGAHRHCHAPLVLSLVVINKGRNRCVATRCWTGRVPQAQLDFTTRLQAVAKLDTETKHTNTCAVEGSDLSATRDQHVASDTPTDWPPPTPCSHAWNLPQRTEQEHCHQGLVHLDTLRVTCTRKPTHPHKHAQNGGEE